MTQNRPETDKQTSLLAAWREQVLTLAARITFFLTLPVTIPGFSEALLCGDYWRLLFVVAALLILAVVAFRRSLRYEWRAALMLGEIYAAAGLWLIMYGSQNNGRLYALLLVVLASLLLQLRYAVIVSVTMVLTMGLIYAAFAARLLPFPNQAPATDLVVLTIFNHWLTQTTLSVVVVAVIFLTIGRLQQSLCRAGQAQADLQALNTDLERRVARRTAKLDRLNAALQSEIQAHAQARAALQASEWKFRGFVEQSWDGILLVDDQGQISEWNRAAEQMMGRRRSEVLGRPVWDVLFEIGPAHCHTSEIYGRLRYGTLELLRSEQAPWNEQGLIHEAIHPDGEQRILRSLIFPIRVDHRILAGSINHDITAQKKLEADLQQRLRQLEALRETLYQITSELELDPLLQAIMERAMALIGATSGQIALYDAERDDLLILACRNLAPELIGTRQPLTEHGTGYVVRERRPLRIPDYATWHSRLPQYARQGGRALLLVPMLAGDTVIGLIIVGHTDPHLHFDEGDVELLTMFAQQATIAVHNAQLYGRLQQLASSDGLTALLNRRSFFERAQRAFEQATRYGQPLSLAMLDIDHFKQVNDRMGHLAGDQVLHAVARQCQESLRSVDIIGRYGGEEIVMLMPETDCRRAQQVAERLCRSIADLVINTDWGPAGVTVSIGVASLPIDSSISLEQLIGHADQALYAAKHAGRNRVLSWER
jgi:diguanylate cyclase (GGDEF)-like protein/PAS domain S-box-containing protein